MQPAISRPAWADPQGGWWWGIYIYLLKKQKTVTLEQFCEDVCFLNMLWNLKGSSKSFFYKHYLIAMFMNMFFTFDFGFECFPAAFPFLVVCLSWILFRCFFPYIAWLRLSLYIFSSSFSFSSPFSSCPRTWFIFKCHVNFRYFLSFG